MGPRRSSWARPFTVTFRFIPVLRIPLLFGAVDSADGQASIRAFSVDQPAITTSPTAKGSR